MSIRLNPDLVLKITLAVAAMEQTFDEVAGDSPHA